VSHLKKKPSSGLEARIVAWKRKMRQDVVGAIFFNSVHGEGYYDLFFNASKRRVSASKSGRPSLSLEGGETSVDKSSAALRLG